MIIFKDYFNLPDDKSFVLKYMYGEVLHFFSPQKHFFLAFYFSANKSLMLETSYLK